VTVRRLIRTIRSIDGIISCRPGPRWSIRRPSRNTTPRSYSRRTRIEAATPVAASTSRTTRTMMTAVSISDQLPLLGRANRESQSGQPFDDDPIARVQLRRRIVVDAERPLRAPDGAVQQDTPAP